MARIYAAIVVAALGLLLARKAKADPAPAPSPYRSYLSGAPAAGPTMTAAGGQVWLGPSIGLNIFSKDLTTGTYQLGIVPGVGYGVKWRPAWYTLTDDLLAFDLFVQASLVDQTSQTPGAKWFTISFMPILTVMDWFSAGIGPDEYIAVDSAPGGLHWVFMFGMQKSL